MNEAVQLVTRAIYNVLGIDKEGHKDAFLVCIYRSEGANFWLSILTDLQNRGVEDILITCVDGLKGFPEAIQSVYPDTVFNFASYIKSEIPSNTSVLRTGKSSSRIWNVYTRLLVKTQLKTNLRNWIKSGVNFILLLSSHGRITRISSLSTSNSHRVYVN